MLNLINGLIALALGIALNLLLIPMYGILGAALATAITLAAWGLWRVVEVWHLLRCFPFTVRSGGLLLGTDGFALAFLGSSSHFLSTWIFRAFWFPLLIALRSAKYRVH